MFCFLYVNFLDLKKRNNVISLSLVITTFIKSLDVYTFLRCHFIIHSWLTRLTSKLTANKTDPNKSSFNSIISLGSCMDSIQGEENKHFVMRSVTCVEHLICIPLSSYIMSSDNQLTQKSQSRQSFISCPERGSCLLASLRMQIIFKQINSKSMQLSTLPCGINVLKWMWLFLSNLRGLTKLRSKLRWDLHILKCLEMWG